MTAVCNGRVFFPAALELKTSREGPLQIEWPEATGRLAVAVVVVVRPAKDQPALGTVRTASRLRSSPD